MNIIDPNHKFNFIARPGGMWVLYLKSFILFEILNCFANNKYSKYKTAILVVLYVR